MRKLEGFLFTFFIYLTLNNVKQTGIIKNKDTFVPFSVN